MAGQFVVTRGGRDNFCTEAELRSMAERGLVDAGDLVYHPVLGRWLYAREVEEIRAPMTALATLGRAPSPEALALVGKPPTGLQQVPANGEAVAGFILGIMGHLPLLGFFCCLAGMYFSSRGLKRAAAMEHQGHGLAVAGMVLSIVFLVPATACSALLLATFLG
ncbi:MAG TPA: hypothetical protein VIA18_31995 [Polyangia bacterium]|jgi:hypothetical protein|nr:hypothetical protein [Polyangia bacterium]